MANISAILLSTFWNSGAHCAAISNISEGCYTEWAIQRKNEITRESKMLRCHVQLEFTAAVADRYNTEQNISPLTCRRRYYGATHSIDR